MSSVTHNPHSLTLLDMRVTHTQRHGHKAARRVYISAIGVVISSLRVFDSRKSSLEGFTGSRVSGAMRRISPRHAILYVLAEAAALSVSRQRAP